MKDRYRTNDAVIVAIFLWALILVPVMLILL